MTPKRPPVVDGDIVRIPLTRGKFALVDLVDADLGQMNWFARADRKVADRWYAQRNDLQKRTVLLHRAVAVRAGLAIDGIDVDHRDGDGLNCRRGNLRAATSTQNKQNRRRPSTNSSGRKGVSWSKRNRRWYARICANRVRHFLGAFLTAEDAAAAYAEAARRLHGEFARTA